MTRTTAPEVASLPLHRRAGKSGTTLGAWRPARWMAAFALAFALTGLSAEAAQMQTLSGHVPEAVANSRVVGRLAETKTLSLAIGLPLRNAAELDALLAEINDPTSAQYHQYLTPAQFAAQFGPTEADYIAVIAFAQANGLKVTATHPNRMLLDVSGSVATVEKALHVNMVSYTHPTRGEFYAPDREPTLDLDVKALDISGLENFDVPKPMGLTKVAMNTATPLVTGSGPGGYFIGKDFRAAYAPGVTLTGANQVIGLLEFDGFYASDVKANFTQANQTPVPVQTVLLDGFSGSAGSDNTEVTLDIMMAAYMAPGLSKIIVYEGTTPNDILNRMATDNLAQQISSSWGYNPITATTEQIFKEYIAQGQSVLQASGDSGAYKNGVMPPSDDPSLTVVGGTTLTTNGAGGPWQSETVWSGSGGGVSTTYTIPTWQVALSMSANGGSTKMRNIPDVALTADPEMFLIQNNGQAIVVGGTSAAAPLWSGFIALANQQATTSGKARIGFLNPLVYAIGESSSYAQDFNDIRSGNNSGFSAVTGYDLTTGWGSPAGQHLITDLTGTTAAATASFTLSNSTATLTLQQAKTATSTVTVTAKNGFSGTVSLAASGLPSGVTAAFSPTSTKTTSVLTFTASSTATAGTYTVTVTGTSGSLTSTTTIALTVVAPSFTLSSSAASLTVPRASSATTTLTVNKVNGFASNVALSVSSLPTGVTAIFSPATTASTSVLTFAANTTATTGTYTITVTGTSGTLKATTTVSITVTAPSFTLAFLPGTLGASRGASAAGVATMTAQNGFKSAVTLSASGLPTGVTATIGAMSSAGTSTITFAASSTATVGNSTVTIKGVSGALSATATFTLTVIAPATGSTIVNLAPNYNVNALVTDYLPFTGSGLDGGLNGSITAYSAALTGVQQTIAGTLFAFGPANAMDSVSNAVVTLPAGQYSSIKLLATGVNGAQAAQTFKVKYTDGTVTTFTQSLSDWFTPQNFTGETKGITMLYRDNGAGQRDNRTFYLYEYGFALNPAKTVASITLPSTRNVVVLAATLSH